MGIMRLMGRAPEAFPCCCCCWSCCWFCCVYVSVEGVVLRRQPSDLMMLLLLLLPDLTGGFADGYVAFPVSSTRTTHKAIILYRKELSFCFIYYVFDSFCFRTWRRRHYRGRPARPSPPPLPPRLTPPTRHAPSPTPWQDTRTASDKGSRKPPRQRQ